MIIQIFLCAIVLLFSFHFAGHFVNIIAKIPSWSTGNPEDFIRYNDSYIKRSTSRFFLPILFASVILGFAVLILVWDKNELTRNLVANELIISGAILITLMTFLGPINVYFSLNYDEPDKLQVLIKQWLFYNKIRFAFILAGLVVSIPAYN